MVERGERANPDAMRLARRRWPSGVVVVLTIDGDGYRGATVSAFTVVSLAPPLVMVCLDREGRMATLVPETGSFAVSVLDRRHEFLAERFAGRAPLADARLTGIGYVQTPSGNPALTGALAWFDCRVRAVHDGGDHAMVVADVESLAVGDDTDDPLIYYEGRYRGIEPF